MTKQELNTILVIIDLCGDYSRELYEDKDVQCAVDSRILKEKLIQAFSEGNSNDL